MAENTNIEWCDHTFNPWTGCTKVSPGCANCYAEGWSKRSGIVTWGKGQPRRRTSEANWRLPLKWNKHAAAAVDGFNDSDDFTPRFNLRPRVFCASLADWLDDEVPVQWLADLLDLIRITPYLDWLLVTKRPENWRSRLEGVREWCIKEPGESLLDLHLFVHEWVARADRPPPPNVWIGTTVEDQQRADERIPLLLGIPAKVRFLSCEPLLGPVQLTAMRLNPRNPLFLYWPLTGHHIAEGMNEPSLNDGAQRIHWVICGGESGPHARPMHPDWARGLRDQCQAVGVPFLFKQWGEWCPRGPESLGYPVIEGVPQFRMTDTGEDGHRAEAGGDNQVWMNRAGKKAAGRQLDGREWNEFPTSS